MPDNTQVTGTSYISKRSTVFWY